MAMVLLMIKQGSELLSKKGVFGINYNCRQVSIIIVLHHQG